MVFILGDYLNRAAKYAAVAIVVLAAVAAAVALLMHSGVSLGTILNPPVGLSLAYILMIALILGILHGATPDEHTWPITFSYAIGSYSTKRGMKAGFTFSLGFTAQRALLTTLGFMGLAMFYKMYNLNGPVYIIVGIAMTVAGAYVLNKRKYLHMPFDVLLRGREHHSYDAKFSHAHESMVKDVPLKMAMMHGLIAGFGFGAYATIITFVLAPQVPGLIYAPLVGVMFGIGTMIMQIIFGAVFANFSKARGLSENDMSYVGRKTAGRTLYYGGAMFALIGLLIILFPLLNNIALSTGNQIPNLDSIGVATVLVLIVVGGIGIGNLILTTHEITSRSVKRRRLRRQRRR